MATMDITVDGSTTGTPNSTNDLLMDSSSSSSPFSVASHHGAGGGIPVRAPVVIMTPPMNVQLPSLSSTPVVALRTTASAPAPVTMQSPQHHHHLRQQRQPRLPGEPEESHDHALDIGADDDGVHDDNEHERKIAIAVLDAARSVATPISSSVSYPVLSSHASGSNNNHRTRHIHFDSNLPPSQARTAFAADGVFHEGSPRHAFVAPATASATTAAAPTGSSPATIAAAPTAPPTRPLTIDMTRNWLDEPLKRRFWPVVSMMMVCGFAILGGFSINSGVDYDSCDGGGLSSCTCSSREAHLVAGSVMMSLGLIIMMISQLMICCHSSPCQGRHGRNNNHNSQNHGINLLNNINDARRIQNGQPPLNINVLPPTAASSPSSVPLPATVTVTSPTVTPAPSAVIEGDSRPLPSLADPLPHDHHHHKHNSGGCGECGTCGPCIPCTPGSCGCCNCGDDDDNESLCGRFVSPFPSHFLLERDAASIWIPIVGIVLFTIGICFIWTAPTCVSTSLSTCWCPQKEWRLSLGAALIAAAWPLLVLTSHWGRHRHPCF
jgi:hypothetical protein